MDIKLAGIEKLSSVDGPGLRYTIFVQGCIHDCYNCHNPETHDYRNGYDIDINKLINDIDTYSSVITGITVSGGDPLFILNYEPVVELCRLFKARYPKKTIWLYTGYSYEYILKHRSDILKYLDVIVDGPFIDRLKSYTLTYRGSSNQRIIDVKSSIEHNNLVLDNIMFEV